MDQNRHPTPVEQQLTEAGISFVINESMAKHTTFNIGGVARFFVAPSTETQLISVISIAIKTQTPCLILGRGSNVLISDDGYDGMVISTSSLRDIQTISSQDPSQVLIMAQCGASLRALATYAAERALTGLEFAHGIPGSVGGALRMNAGAYGGEMSMVVQSIRCLDCSTGEILCFKSQDFAFSKRKSLLAKRPELICLSALFALPSPPASSEEKERIKQQIFDQMEDLRQRRRTTQPLEYPSAGSVFKRPEGYFAGKLIEDCGLKGLQIGGAQVSPKHAGFIVNLGNATAADVQTLISEIKNTVWEQFHVHLEEEIIWIE